MGRWFQEEVAGDRYIFDSDANPVVLGCPQGAPVWVIEGEQARAAQRACDAHNADIDALTAEVDAREAVITQLLAMLEPGEEKRKRKRIHHEEHEGARRKE